LVHHFLEESAREFPAKTALVHGKTRANYSEVNRWANQLAGWLLDRGLKRGGRVVVLVENSLEYVISYYGVMKAAGIVVPLSPDLKADNLGLILDELEAGFIIGGAKAAKTLQTGLSQGRGGERLILKAPAPLRPNSAFAVVAWEELFEGGAAPNPDLPVGAGETCSIIYTSGSTGRPKGVMLSHANLVSNTHAICEYLRLTSSDIQLVVLPFFYVMGKSLLNTHFAVGGQVVINNQFAYPAAVVQQLINEKVTGFSGVPSTFAYLLYRSPLEKHRDELTHLRYCSQAGGHMPRHLKTELRRVLPPHAEIYVMYGATEAAARIAYLPPGDFDRKLDSIGKPLRGVHLSVLNENGEEAGAGQRGELVASGPNIMQGYWKDTDSTAKVLDGRGYRTGDLGYRDEEGFFYLTGRKDEMIKVGGHRVNPQEVEDAILATGAIIMCAVVGLDDPLLGKRLAAAVVMKDKSTSCAELLQACSERLPKHKMPSEIKIVERLPLNSNGKIDKKECLALFYHGRLEEEKMR
jgi:acyl-CoA synthetase (AMP-forming)/AMP-acid ligase II